MKPSVIVFILIFLFSAVCTSQTQKRIASGEESQPPDLSDLSYRKCWALVVGINKYPYLSARYQLRYAVADAEDVAKLLRDKFHFSKVTVLLDEGATKEGILKSLASLADPEKVKSEDCVLVYFSGHGQTVTTSVGGEMGYLIPYDARVDLSKQPNPAQYLLYCIGMDELHRTAQNIKAKHLLFIVDACYSGLVLSSSKGLDHSAHGYLVKVARARTEQMITAGGQGEESAESSEWGHGAFTYKLIESLQDGIADSDDDGVVMGSELGTHLRTTVLQLTEGEQTPQFRMQGEGEFLFFLDSGRSNEVTSIISKEKPPFQPNGKWRVTARNIILGFVPVLLVAIMLNRLKRRNPARGSAIGIIMLLVATLNRLKQRKKGHVDPRDPTHPETFTGNDGAPMVLIPEGEFLMGSDEGDPCERPVHAVCLNPFYMDVYEVTNGQYARFLNEYGKHTDLNGNRFLDVDNDYCLIEKEGDTYRPREDYEKHPVIYVSWYGAKAYAEHYGKRLPTEAEWEKAARGGLAGEKYPWGEGFDPAKANYNQGQEEEDVLEALKPVGQSPPNGYGLYDMAGNVLEWCANEYIGGFEGYLDDTYGSGAEPLFCDKKERVVRGGSWSSPDPQYLRVAYRYKVMEGECDGSIGFRCVQDSRGGS